MEEYSKKKVGVFIDEANLYYSQKSLGWKISFSRLKEYVSKIGEISVLNIYSGYEKENYKQKRLFKKLRNIGYKIIRKEIKFIKDKERILKKGNLDIELSLDAYMKKDQYNVFILFSGDSDFVYLMNLFKKENKEIIVFSSRRQISSEILEKFKFININKIRKELER